MDKLKFILKISILFLFVDLAIDVSAEVNNKIRIIIFDVKNQGLSIIDNRISHTS